MLSKLKTKKFYISVIILIVIIFSITAYFFHDRENRSAVAVIPIVGYLYASPQYNTDGSIDKSDVISTDIVAQIRKANEDKRVKAIVFLIDSGGGEIFTAEEITSAIKEVRKPTVALIRGLGVSSAYWIATATGRIFALQVSATTDIGVTNSYTDNSKQNTNNGITFHQLSYGKYKDTFNVDKPLTSDEEKLAMAQTTEQANIFIKEVAENRHLPIEKVQALADGSVILGQDAIKFGLVDELGSFADVDRYLSKLLKENIEIKIPSEVVEK